MIGLIFALLMGVGQISSAQTGDPAVTPVTSKSADTSIFSNSINKTGKFHRSTFWVPLLSYIAPGVGQFSNGKEHAGAIYSSIAFVGLGTGIYASHQLDGNNYTDEELTDLDSRDPNVRLYLWGMKTFDLAGSLSLYHTFRTAVNVQKQLNGEYSFLPGESETTGELMLAPLEFSFLGRWTTYVPLVAGLGLAVGVSAFNKHPERQVNGGDILFSTGISYNAGVGEEALFRGWLFPLLAEGYGVENLVWANLTQASIFGLLHYSSENPFPVAQTALGFYFGWLAKRNGWSLKEAIFVHTWWDIIVFTAAMTQGERQASIYVPLYQTQF